MNQFPINQSPACVYLNTYFEIFILPLIRAFREPQCEFNIDITKMNESAKRNALLNLFISVGFNGKLLF